MKINQWISTLSDLANDMQRHGTIYGWKSPVCERITMKESTCVGYVSLALQRAGLMPSGKYIHFTDTGKLHGTGASYVRNHPKLYEVCYVGKTPQKLKSVLQVGDICGYKTHIQVFAGWKGDTPLWWSLERSSKGAGYKVKLTEKGVFSYYSKRKIDCIVRISFSDGVPIGIKPAEPKKKFKRYKVKTKEAQNVRQEPTAKSPVIGRIPKGKTKTVWDKKGTFGKVKNNGQYGWINIDNHHVEALK